MVRNLPNLLTLTRILLLPFFAVTMIYDEYGYALLIFISAAVTDLLDGYTARVTNQISYFGSILDPVADKFFLLTSFVFMTYAGLIPQWFTIAVIGRDLIVVTGSIILYFVIQNLKIVTSKLGKISSACQFALVGLTLLFSNIKQDIHVPVSLFVVVALITAISGLDYVSQGMKMANDHNDS